MTTTLRKKSAEPASQPEPSAHAFTSYADYLAHQIATEPKRRKGDRTRTLLKYGAVKVLDSVGYHAMRVSDICDAVGVAAATFYLYFENKEAITRVVLTDYIEAAMTMMANGPAEASAFAAIRAANLKWIKITYANAGLTRCILQLGDEAPDFRDLVHSSNRRWYEAIAQSLLHDQVDGAAQRDVALLTAYALGGMMDEMARKLVIHPDPMLVALKDRLAESEEDLAEFLAVLWYRALHGSVPDNQDMGAAARSAAKLGSRNG